MAAILAIIRTQCLLASIPPYFYSNEEKITFPLKSGTLILKKTVCGMQVNTVLDNYNHWKA